MALRIGIFAAILVSVPVGIGLLVAALVAWLEPMTGLAGALAIAGLGFLAIALALGLLLGALARAARRRRQTKEALVGLTELLLVLLPRRQLRRLEAGVAAGVGLAALVGILLRPASGRDDKESP